MYCFIIWIKGFPQADKFVLADKLLFLADEMKLCKNGRCEQRPRRREAPTTAGAAATAALRAHPPFAHIAQFSHNLILLSQK